MYVVRSPQPLTKETANVNAATAAASAFKRRASDASLSSAAAAAALRARPTSPTIVADVQSKRLSRRSPSVSSATGRRRELTRTPSVGSMMERTFRSPSPGRSPAPVPYDVPPIPSIPATDNYKPSSRPSGSSRKGGAGLQTQNFRTASEKMRNGQRGSWFAAASAQDLHGVRRTASELQLVSARAPSEPRPGSVSPSINFSYPRARLHSPTGSLRSLQLDDQTLVYDPNSRRMVPRAQLEARSQAIYEEEDYQPTREKPKTKKAPRQPKEPKPPRLSRAGSHLSRGTVARTRAPALETNEAEQPDRITEPEPETEPSRAAEPEAVAAPAKPKAKKKRKKKQTEAPSTIPPDSTTAEMPSSPVAPVKAPEMTATVSENSASTPSTAKKAAKSSNPNGATPSPNAKSNVRTVASREPSESPARSARFAASTDQLLVRHEPPPRSLSPRKSALKHTSPTRAVSPSDDGSEVSGVPSSLTPNDDARKKSYRVSWDDRNTVVVSEPTAQHAAEQAASSSPQTKKLWHGIVGKGKKKEATVVETEETMSPRPALPSFGSVREKKPKEQEERPLVRPEHAIQTETPTAAMAASPVETYTAKLREPLPTVLPSVEKDEDVSSSEDGLMEDTSDDDSDPDAAAPHVAANDAATKRNATENGVPEISVSQASPRQPQTDERGQIAPARVADDDASSGSEGLEEEDPHSHATSLQMDDIKEEEEEGDTYIDAYEQIDELEGNGFQSLDAVLESPTSSPTTKTAKEKIVSEDELPEAIAAVNNKSDPPDDWENAKAYWKSLSAAKRRQLEQEAMAEAGDEQQEKSKASKTDTRKSSKAKAQNITPQKERSYQITPGTVQQAFESTPESATPTNSVLKANGNSMRKSMRDSAHNDAPNSEPKKLGGSLRKTLRPERPLSAGNDFLSQPFAEPSSPTSPSRMKRSLRHNSVDLSGAEVRLSLSGAGRPASYHAATDSPSSLRQTQSLRMNGSASTVSATRGAVIKSSLRRHGSDSSESSFTRSRASSSGVHEFRRSMRGSMREPPAASEGVKESNRFSLRPSSPPAMAIRRNSVSSLPPAANFGAGRMRHSLRGVSADPPSRRRMPGFGKSAGKAKKGKGGSRFGDSSDEDEGPANFFRSRFADSSSEDDEPQTKPKGKGLPKSLRAKSNGRPNSSAVDLPFTQNGRESPSMFDNAILTQPKRTEAIGSPLGAPGSSLEIPAQTDDNDGPGRGSFRPQHTRRGSFISLLRRKKDPSSKITRDVSESAARQDTHLERSPQELEALRNTSMHKRGPSWPLSEPEEAGLGADHSPERPSTAGGAIVSTSSNTSKFARRRSASHGMVAADTVDIDDDHLVTDALPQKKKKFGALRKMFGLHD
ncbi:hypothetical protein NLG97_g786 [Lecanicillium saksenae]|uniref:Uncharacterized protein n=1 Tax=Lecanicillium saksenae TaxID=468837 RepID=A0ACC1R705_9HYPO|nr:hypothetical protein NLG97_g786 [Lecanicillium saksenae]